MSSRRKKKTHDMSTGPVSSGGKKPHDVSSRRKKKTHDMSTGPVSSGGKKPQDVSTRHGLDGGVDHISDLPDEMLHTILARLPSTAAAARTSVLSRRWRLLWTGVPELFFDSNEFDPRIADAIDAALAAYTFPALDRLTISINICERRDAARCAPWLRFAAQHHASELILAVDCLPWRVYGGLWSKAEELELPVWERATAITLQIIDANVHLRVPAAAGDVPSLSFAALRVLNIHCDSFDEVDVGRLVSSMCPQLQDLTLVAEESVSDFSLRSGSLERLVLCVGVAFRLTVEAPSLRELVVGSPSHPVYAVYDPRSTARFAVPKLAEVSWHGVYDPRSHQIVEAPRHLRKLVMLLRARDLFNPETSAEHEQHLLRRFDAVDELTLRVSILEGRIEYESFLNGTTKLPKCKALTMRFYIDQPHCIAAVVLQLIRKCIGFRSLHIINAGRLPKDYRFNNLDNASDCPCDEPEYQNADGIVMDSLEEVEISDFIGTDDEVDMMKLLLKCKPDPKRVNINLSKRIPDVPTILFSNCITRVTKIDSLFHPSTKVELRR